MPKKRTKNIIHLKNGKTELSLHWPDGERFRRRMPNDRTANELLVKIQYEIKFGDWRAYRDQLDDKGEKAVAQSEKDISIAELADRYYNEWCLSRHKRPDADEKELKNVVRILGGRRLQSFTRQDGNDFYNTRLGEKATRGPRMGQQLTVCAANHGLTILSGMLRWAWKEKGWIPSHPMEDFKWEKPDKKKRFPLDGIEVRRMVAEAMTIDDVVGRLLGIMSETAIRIDEALKLKRLFFDVRNRQMILERSKATPEGRQVPLSAWAMELATGLPVVFGNEFLFVRLENRAVPCRTYVVKVMEQARLAAGISFKARPHDLRHFRAITWLENLVDLDKVREWMGHKNIATTQVYLKYVSNRATAAFEEANRRELEKLNRAGMEAAQ